MLIPLVLLGISIFLWIYSYDAFIDTLVKDTGKEYLIDSLKEQYFTINKFEFLRWVLSLLTLIFMGLAVVIWEKIPTLSNFSKKCFRGGWKEVKLVLFEFRQLKGIIRIIYLAIIIIFTARGIYYLIHFLPQYDECWTYNYFTGNNIIYSLGVFNTHPLYIIISHFFKWLPFEMHVNMRIPVLLTGLLTCLIFYRILKKIFDEKMALIGLAYFAFCPPVGFYSMYARGYIFVVLFVLLSSYSLIKLCQKNLKKHALIFMLSTALGLYSMPTYLYVLVSQMVFLIIVKKDISNLRFFKWIFGACLIALLLYLPMILGTGIGMGVQTAITSQFSWSNFFNQFHFHLVDIGYWLIGVRWGWIFLLGLVIVSIWFWKKENHPQIKHWVSLSFVVVILPIIFMLGQRIMIYERIWVYLSIFITFLICVLFQKAANLFSKNIVLAFGLIIGSSGLFLTHYHRYLNWSVEADHSVKTVAQIMMKRDIEEYSQNFDYYQPGIEYYFKLSDLKIKVQSSNPESKNYLESFEKTNTILWNKEIPFTGTLNDYNVIHEDNLAMLLVQKP